MSQKQKCALVMAGGTGGHIFPGLAVAAGLREQGWRVHWLGAPDSMEARLVPPQGFPLETIHFGGVRGKGVLTLALLPLRLLRAFAQAVGVMRRVRPDVLLGFGGYIAFPGAVMGVAMGKRLVIHEQNAVAGMVNKWLAHIADRVFIAFPGAFKPRRRLRCVGNPLRAEFAATAEPAQRFAGREGPLRLLVVGGSLGAAALNEAVPQALALLPEAERPQVVHQSGASQIDALQAHYRQAGVVASLLPFIDDMAAAYAGADVVICRAGASTVSEIAAVGVPALFVPFPHAVDDHQTVNARHLVDADAAWLLQQSELTPQVLADWLRGLTREQLLEVAQRARAQRQLSATAAIVEACQELVP